MSQLGSKADLTARKSDFRSTLESRHGKRRSRLPQTSYTDDLDLFYQPVQPPDGSELARYPDFRPTATDDDW
jgi:hypothetical protein